MGFGDPLRVNRIPFGGTEGVVTLACLIDSTWAGMIPGETGGKGAGHNL